MANHTPEERRRRNRAASLRYYRANRAKEALRYQRRSSKPEYRLRRKKLHNDRKEAIRVSLAGRSRPEFCDVCGRNDGGVVFDHCHKLGHFRGWICGKCNWVLGLVDDDPDILRKLIAYLKRTSDYTPPQLTLPGI